MGTSYVPDNPKTGFHSSTRVSANFTAIQQALEDSLSRKGVAPNQMEAELDMNSQRLLNLPTPNSIHEPVTIAYLNTLTAPPAVANVGNPMPLDLDMNTFRATNASDPLLAQDYVTLNYFDNQYAGSAAVGPLDADTLDGLDSAADPLVPVFQEIPYWDVNGDLSANSLLISGPDSVATATHVAIASSDNKIVLTPFASLKSQLGGSALEFVTTTPAALTGFIGTEVVTPHTLGGFAGAVMGQLICVTPEHNFAAGDRIPMPLAYEEAGGGTRVSWGAFFDENNVTARVQTSLSVTRTDTGAFVALTPANWNVIFILIGTVV